MSFNQTNESREEDLISLLKELLQQMKLLNARIEEAFDTKIKDHDL